MKFISRFFPFFCSEKFAELDLTNVINIKEIPFMLSLLLFACVLFARKKMLNPVL